MLTDIDSMRLMVAHKLSPIGVILLILVAVAAVLACQFHTMPLDHQQDAPGNHQGFPFEHAMLDFSCLTAVLPAMTVFTLLSGFLFYASPVWVKDAVPAYPPFKPPEKYLA